MDNNVLSCTAFGHIVRCRSASSIITDDSRPQSGSLVFRWDDFDWKNESWTDSTSVVQ